MTRPHRERRLPSPEEIEENDEIDETPNEFYLRHAAEEADHAAEYSKVVKSQRDAEYKLVLGFLALVGLIKLVEEAGDARL